RNDVHVAERFIGLLFLLNSAAIIVLQVPVARAVEGRRRMRAFAVMAVCFAGSWLLVGSAAKVGAVAASLGVAAAFLGISIAECLYDAVQGPLVADLAPSDQLGRYVAMSGFAWQLGFIVGPVAGAALLAWSPAVLWLSAAGLCLAAAAFALDL